MFERIKSFWRRSQSKAWAKIQAVLALAAVSAPQLEKLFTDPNAQPWIQKTLGDHFLFVMFALAAMTYLCAPHGEDH